MNQSEVVLAGGTIAFNDTPGYSIDAINKTTDANITIGNKEPCVPAYLFAIPHNFVIFTITITIVLDTLISVLGIAGNILSIVILSKEKHLTTSIYLLRALAISDMSFLMLVIFIDPMYAMYTTTHFVPQTAAWPNQMTSALPYILPVISTSQTLTTWMVLLVTIDRFIQVCIPLSASRLCTLPRAKMAVVVTVGLSFMYNVPRFWEYVPNNVQFPCGTTVVLGYTAFGKNNYYTYIYQICLNAIFRYMGPVLVLIILNGNLIIALKDAHRRRQQMTGNEKEAQNITFTLVIVATSFLLCIMPYNTVNVMVTLWNTNNAAKPDQLIMRYLLAVGNFLLKVNSSVNFLIYCLTGKRFRETFISMCCPGFRRGQRYNAVNSKPPKELSDNSTVQTVVHSSTKGDTKMSLL
ncbi:unnamed protein product [Owenia fusiformis]|uniref:Uncharacterized protein n=1 Tax=Owenia fusiformis TaxID=6347 RepID=A0A8J1UPU8_OWEFU|nr:unnamed protein product [Owenia fusiformis]